MKKLLITTLLFAGAYSIASAQSAKFNPDSSITYQQSHFKKGDTVQLFYGSGADKDFKFIQIINLKNFMNHPDMLAIYSKDKFVIDYVFLKDGKCTIRGKAPFTDDADDLVVVDVEGAIDNKEIVAPNNISAIAKKPTFKKHR